jgi:hypothetical protein
MIANSLVVFDPKFTKEEWEDKWEKAYPFKRGEVLLSLGEIIQMPGHCIVVKKNGQTFWGFSTDNFRYPKPNEI